MESVAFPNKINSISTEISQKSSKLYIFSLESFEDFLYVWDVFSKAKTWIKNSKTCSKRCWGSNQVTTFWRLGISRDMDYRSSFDWIWKLTSLKRSRRSPFANRAPRVDIYLLSLMLCTDNYVFMFNKYQPKLLLSMLLSLWVASQISWFQ